MVWKSNYGSPSEEEGEGKIAWDLRQIFAKDIVGETLKQIAIARKNQDFPMWFKLLKRDLFTEVYKNINEEQIKDIREQIQKTIEVICNNRNSYIRKTQNQNPQENENIEDALCELERLITRAMQSEGMFGSKEIEDDGL